MTDGEYQIDEDTFKGMSVERQNWIIYSTFNKQRDDCNKRFCKLEKSKRIDKGLAIGSGFAGGLTAWLGKWIFFK
jgi:hypothetical protein